MKFCRKTPIIIIQFVLIFVSLWLVIAFISGCSTLSKTTQKITRDITGRGGKLKKKVAIAIVANTTFIDTSSFQKLFHQNLSENFNKACAENLFIHPGDTVYPNFLIKLPKKSSGEIDNFDIATSSRKIGINAIVTGSFVSIKAIEKQKGIMWFKEPRPIVQLKVVMEVYDTETGAKLLDEGFVQEFEIDDTLWESIRKKQPIDITALNEPFKRIISSISEKICDVISEQPWKGFVISISGAKVIISSGRDTGIIPGDILEVYDSADTIVGMDSRKFFLPGLKSGEIKITAIFPNRSEAIIISGENIKEGSTVKFR